MAAIPPGREDFFNLDAYLLNACINKNVKIDFNVNATAEKVIAAVADGRFSRVVIATGAVPLEASFPIAEGANVLQAWDVLKGSGGVKDEVVIVGGSSVGVGTALLMTQFGTLDNETLHFLYLQKAEPEAELYRLATEGCKHITLVETERIGGDIGLTTRSSMLADLKRFKVNGMNNTKVLEVTKDGVIVENAEGRKLIPADTVILALGSASNNELYQALKGKIAKLHVIGDAARPAKALNAIHMAYAEAARISG